MADDDAEGTEIEVTAGQELYSPVQYNNFTVGPFTLRTQVKRGETVEQAFERARGFLASQMRAEFVAKKQRYMENFKGLKG